MTHLRGTLLGLGWDKSIIMGHSMGAGASMLYSGCYPETVHKLVLIDGFGSNTRPSSAVCKQTRLAIDKELGFYMKHNLMGATDKANVSYSFAASPLGSKVYANVQAAISARLNKLKTYPGTQSMSYEAAATIIKRGMMYADGTDTRPNRGSEMTNIDRDYEEVDLTSARPVVFSHDPRLYLPSYTSMNMEQVFALFL